MKLTFLPQGDYYSMYLRGGRELSASRKSIGEESRPQDEGFLRYRRSWHMRRISLLEMMILLHGE